MTDLKICLPGYKVAYSLCFVILLSLVRGISSEHEIGMALVPNMALLAIVCCSDTYWMEYRERRGELCGLYSVRKRTGMVFRRLGIQMLYLYALSFLGYLCFLVQSPNPVMEIKRKPELLMFALAAAISIVFFSLLSMTMVNCLRNIWAGIGISFLLWLTFNSKVGEQLFGKWNVFSYVFKQEETSCWLCGQGTAAIGILLMVSMCSLIIKRRG